MKISRKQFQNDFNGDLGNLIASSGKRSTEGAGIAGNNMIELNITPIGKPRMTQRDKWAHRPVVDKYFAYKDELNLKANQKCFKLGAELKIIFHLPMPKSWSKKERLKMNGKPHQAKPDIDNILKGFFDCLTGDDSFIYSVSAKKFWAETGKIQIENFEVVSLCDCGTKYE